MIDKCVVTKNPAFAVDVLSGSIERKREVSEGIDGMTPETLEALMGIDTKIVLRFVEVASALK